MEPCTAPTVLKVVLHPLARTAAIQGGKVSGLGILGLSGGPDMMQISLVVRMS
jgi:hypothetical protein